MDNLALSQSEFIDRLKILTHRFDTLKITRDELEKTITVDKSYMENNVKFIDLTQQFITHNLNNRLLEIESIVNIILIKYFQKRFKIEISYERNSTNITFMTTRDMMNDNFHPIKLESGGGVKDIVSFIVRVALLSYTSNARILFMDEPFKNISDEFKEIIESIVKELSSNFNIQIITVLHDKDFLACADNIINIESEHGGDVATEDLLARVLKTYEVGTEKQIDEQA